MQSRAGTGAGAPPARPRAGSARLLRPAGGADALRARAAQRQTPKGRRSEDRALRM